MNNKSLHLAKAVKNDEFYTLIEDVEKEIPYYADQLQDKIIYCNCDNPESSAFWKYFHLHFTELGLKKLIATYFDKTKPVYKTEYIGGNDKDILAGFKTALIGNGSFDSDECREILEQSDIVISNPPFSYFRSYIQLLMEYNKQFLVIGSKNAIGYKNFFSLMREGVIKCGVNPSVSKFLQPDGVIKKFGNIGWFTNLQTPEKEFIHLTAKYSIDKYEIYDNYAAFNVDKIKDIPEDDTIKTILNQEQLDKFKSVYGEDLEIIDEDDGGKFLVSIKRPIWGVPITLMDKYNPQQFDIVAFRKGEDGQDLMFTRERERIYPYSRILVRTPCSTSVAGMIKSSEGKINGKPKYCRITIRQK